MSTLLGTEYGVENIVKSFGGAKALSGVSLTVKAGEVHCIAGENGSGKSTLIKIMSGVHAPDSGLVRLGDKVFTELSPRDAVREGVQVIFQDFSLQRIHIFLVRAKQSGLQLPRLNLLGLILTLIPQLLIFQ
jgi:simple sugar transport system ATP-binding protein